MGVIRLNDPIDLHRRRIENLRKFLILSGLKSSSTSEEERKRLMFEMRSRSSTLGFGRYNCKPLNDGREKNHGPEP